MKSDALRVHKKTAQSRGSRGGTRLVDDSGFQSRPSPLSRRRKYSVHIETVLSTVAGTVAGTVRGTVRHTVAGTAGMKKPALGGLEDKN